MTVKRKMDLKAVKDFISNQSMESKVYIGCDSSRFKKNGKWFAEFYSVVVVHINGKNGCKIFGSMDIEEDFSTYNKKKVKPNYRLMKEVYKVSELYLELYDVLVDREIELHLDLNPNEKYISSEVVQQAIGYIKGTCDIVPKVKPASWASSYAADRWPKLAAA